MMFFFFFLKFKGLINEFYNGIFKELKSEPYDIEINIINLCGQFLHLSSEN